MKNSVIGKRVVLVLILFALCTFQAAAQEDSFGLDEKVGMVLQLLSSPWVKGIACIALIAECIGLITAGRQEPGMFKKFIPWIAGTILFMAAGTITSKFVNIETTTFNEALQLDE
ncbi:MAG: TrbC/VirB2 family protein [Treponema sp.]|jgi:type IV secretory pathway VirB2 component (pilin)|nr:TrbC/VirB2 family protein [Treponema sp.]